MSIDSLVSNPVILEELGSVLAPYTYHVTNYEFDDGTNIGVNVRLSLCKIGLQVFITQSTFAITSVLASTSLTITVNIPENYQPQSVDINLIPCVALNVTGGTSIACYMNINEFGEIKIYPQTGTFPATTLFNFAFNTTYFTEPF